MPATTQKNPREEGIFDGALQLPPEEREHYIQIAAEGDAPLAQRVRALLDAHEETAGPLAQTTLAVDTEMVRSPLPLLEKPGDKIGRYKVLQLIGQGTFGVVFMAEQEEPVRRRVALKVLKAGMDSKEVLARFEAERQALARMNHPSIATVLDGGATDSGRPYFVMELVKGEPLTKYCDEACLSTNARLRLFTQICLAVQHAHQKGIIHRDLKPANILVTEVDGRAVPKVIDFGVAKATQVALTEKTLFTRYGQVVGTLEYMSPEQVNLGGLDIDTRADIYSLGVILYELLTGRKPLDSKQLLAAGWEAMVKVIREVEPLKPSTRLRTLSHEELSDIAQKRRVEPRRLNRLVHGELDWIVMKALDKDRSRRYDTAGSFTSDIENFLAHQPISARPATPLYRFRKLVRRNKLVVGAAAAIALTVISGLVVSLWQLGLARQAQQRSDQAVKMLQDVLAGAEPTSARGRDTALIRAILEKTVERMGQDLKAYPEIQAEMLTTIGQVYYSVGEIAAAEQMQRKAYALLEHRSANREQFATCLDALGLVLREQSQFSNAVVLLRRAVEIRAGTVGKNHPHYANSLNSLGVALRSLGDLKGSEQCHREALSIQTAYWSGARHGSMVASLNNLGLTLRDKGALVQAEQCFRDSLAIQTNLLADPASAPTIGLATANLAFVLRDEGRFAEAESAETNALEQFQKTLPPDHPAIATVIHDLAMVLQAKGETQRAEALHREALEIRLKKFGEQNSVTATSMNDLALVIRTNKPNEAEDLVGRALVIRTNLYGELHLAVASSYNNLGLVFQAQGKLPEAEIKLRQALDLEERLLGQEHYSVATTLNNLALVLRDRGEFKDALDKIGQAIAIRQKTLDAGHPALKAALADKDTIEAEWRRTRIE